MSKLKQFFLPDDAENPSGSSGKNNTHIRALDGLRAFACLLVVISHSVQADFFPHTFRYNLFLTGIDKFGVMLFFVLSGFLMSYLYLSKDCSPKSILKYTISRFARIYPLFIFVLFLHWLYFYAGFSNPSPNISFVEMTTTDFWLHIFLLKGDGVFWTISTEFRFYAFFICIWLVFAKFIKKPAILYVLLFGGFILLSMVKYDAAQIHLLYSLHFFLAGTLAGDIYARYQDQIKKAFCGYEFFIFLDLFILSFPNIYLYFFNEEQLRFQNEMNAVICAGLVFFAATGGNLVKIIMGNKLACFLGTISFSIYLIHRPLLSFYKAALDFYDLPTNILMFFPYLLITIAMSTISYYLIEKAARRGI